MSEKNVGLTFILGGCRSGKSDHAENLASAYESVIYVATAEAVDEEMAQRIAGHRAKRPAGWETLEVEGVDLPERLADESADAVLIDSLTLYVSRVMARLPEPARHLQDLVQVAATCPSDVIVVSDEVGLGVVPASADGRAFRDLLGWVNQLFAAAADNVDMVVAGLPLRLKRGQSWKAV